ncbi:MAG: DAK2 domain-containing protein [Anaerolineae bacterium]
MACNGLGLKHLLKAGQQWLESHLHEVNNLNVFPVPDGDTGTNMVLTMRSALAEAGSVTDDKVGTMAAALAHGALMGARGNSGVILSQFLQGMATALADKTSFEAADLAVAAQSGAELAYQSVLNPVEGTILTVARALAEAGRQSVKNSSDLAQVWREIVEAAKIAQANTPELLPILKEAGVTDSGGQGLVYLMEGGLRFLQGEPLQADSGMIAAPKLLAAVGSEAESYGYDVQFLIHGDRLNVAEIRAQIDRLGWSTLVVGDEHTVKVHVHTQDPGIPLSYGASQGRLSDVVVENMEQQAKEFARQRAASSLLPPPTVPLPMAEHLRDSITPLATVCVAPGQGLAQILQSLGASRIVFGGQTMNPSPQELLEAIEQVHGHEVLLLPNNSNVILAAQQAQKLAAKKVQVVPTKTIPQGIAALLSFNFQGDLESNAQRMLAAAQQVHTVEITRAVRETQFNGFQIKSGDVMGLFDDELVSVGQAYDEVALETLAKVDLTAQELITIYFGQDSSAAHAQVLAAKITEQYPELEVEAHEGGQPFYYYIISLE